MNATLIYDGNCGFCRRWVERVRRWDRHGRLTLLPYQTPDLETRFPQLSRAECRQRMHLVAANGEVHRGADAGREVLRRLPAGWLWTLPFLVPGASALAERIYVWITYRWGPLKRAVG
jgi:predicted DCC family thiol-disulfide oxidoreductase YuxK